MLLQIGKVNIHGGELIVFCQKKKLGGIFYLFLFLLLRETETHYFFLSSVNTYSIKLCKKKGEEKEQSLK